MAATACDLTLVRALAFSFPAPSSLQFQNRMIFVPDSKTAEGRRLVAMSRRAFETVQNRCDARQQGWVFPSRRSASGHLKSICNLFRKRATKRGLRKNWFSTVRDMIMVREF